MVHAYSCSGTSGAVFFISINIYNIGVALLQWLEICLSFGSSCFTIFIENVLHGCSESEHFGEKVEMAQPRFSHIFRRCEQGNLFRAPYCNNENIDIWHHIAWRRIMIYRHIDLLSLSLISEYFMNYTFLRI